MTRKALHPMPEAPAILIYDGECPMCRRAQAWFTARVPSERLMCIPCQSPERERLAPQIPLDECLTAMQLILPDGTRYSGEQALPVLLRMTPHWRWLGRILGTRVFLWVAKPIYRTIARRRFVLSAFFADGDCHTGACSSPRPPEN